MKEIFVAMMAATSPSDDVVRQHSIFSAFENMEQCEQYLVKEFSEYTDASLKKNGIILTLYVNGEDFGKDKWFTQCSRVNVPEKLLEKILKK